MRKSFHQLTTDIYILYALQPKACLQNTQGKLLSVLPLFVRAAKTLHRGDPDASVKTPQPWCEEIQRNYQDYILPLFLNLATRLYSTSLTRGIGHSLRERLESVLRALPMLQNRE